MNNPMKPYVICHMMSTIDGKITSGIDGVDILGDYFGVYTETEDQLTSDAWMCGRVTMEMFASGKGTPLSVLLKIDSHDDYIAVQDAETYLIGVDTQGLLRWNTNIIQLSNVPTPSHLIIIVTQQTPKDYLAYLKEQHISYVFGGEKSVDFQLVFEKLQQTFHINRLLLEGGGILNGSIIKDNLIDEMSLILCPVIANYSKAPAVFENLLGELQVKKFTLSAVSQQKNGTVWVRYIKEKS